MILLFFGSLEDIPGSPFVARSGLDKNVQTNFVEAMVNIHTEFQKVCMHLIIVLRSTLK